MKQLIIITLAAIGLLANSSSTGYQVGENVDDFTLKNTDGQMVTLSDYADKGAIIVFDCNTCPYSQAYRERIKDLDTQFATKGYPVIAINPNSPDKSPGDAFDKMIAYAKEHNYKHAYLQDADQTVARAFGATNTPHVFIVQKASSKLTLKYIGAIDNNTKNAADADKKYVEDAVNALLNGKEPPLDKTKAIGCTIKWAAN